MEKLRVGIFFGGPSREREISFAGGRTVYDNLDKSLFDPVPIFIDSRRTMILLDWQYIYKGTIRDFYPPVEYVQSDYQVYVESLSDVTGSRYAEMIDQVGKQVDLTDLVALIDVAFLALHGEYGEDGQLQGLLSGLGIPYTGSGIMSCALGMDKGQQKKYMEAGGFATPDIISISREVWQTFNQDGVMQSITDLIGYPVVIRPANQGSSIGVSIIYEHDIEVLRQKIDAAFFTLRIDVQDWLSMGGWERRQWLADFVDIRGGLGLPVKAHEQTIYTPEQLVKYLESTTAESILLEAANSEKTVIAESFIKGREFSTIVIRQEDGSAIALPPTEIRKGDQLYDYKSKYLPGLSRKITPIDLPDDQIEAIRKESQRLFDYLSFQTYARIDGFIQDDGTIYLNDPNTTSGMLPSSFFFHQAAEVGLSPGAFLTYIIRTSLNERIKTSLTLWQYEGVITQLDKLLASKASNTAERTKVAVILGGYSFERHISVESGRNIYEKLQSSVEYEPIPVFLKQNEEGFDLYHIPINLLLKDNADDIADKIEDYKVHPIVKSIVSDTTATLARYQSSTHIDTPLRLSMQDLAEQVDAVFIALHGRPGEDGTLQQELRKVGLPYNGSDHHSSSITINKYETLQRLRKEGFTVADQLLLSREEYLQDNEAAIASVVDRIKYPMIVKPVDDGCSSAVRKIDDEASLYKYLDVFFRDGPDLTDEQRTDMQLAYNEEFPSKEVVLIETLVEQGSAKYFLEITGGLLTHMQEDRTISYQMLEPSEALSGGEILSLEEKFLAGEGQNITPARYTPDGAFTYNHVADQVKADLKRAAEVLGVTGYARIDAFVRIFDDGRAETIIIEVNSLPGMTPATCIFHQTALAGMRPVDFIDRILRFGIASQQRSTTVS